jgi:hypothetical protein
LGACSGSQLQLFQQPHYGNFTLEHALEVAGQLDEELLVYAKEMKQMRAKEGRVATLEKKLNRLSDASRGHGIISMDLEREVNELSLEREGLLKMIKSVSSKISNKFSAMKKKIKEFFANLPNVVRDMMKLFACTRKTSFTLRLGGSLMGAKGSQEFCFSTEELALCQNEKNCEKSKNMLQVSNLEKDDVFGFGKSRKPESMEDPSKEDSWKDVALRMVLQYVDAALTEKETISKHVEIVAKQCATSDKREVQDVFNSNVGPEVVLRAADAGLHDFVEQERQTMLSGSASVPQVGSVPHADVGSDTDTDNQQTQQTTDPKDQQISASEITEDSLERAPFLLERETTNGHPDFPYSELAFPYSGGGKCQLSGRPLTRQQTSSAQLEDFGADVDNLADTLKNQLQFSDAEVVNFLDVFVVKGRSSGMPIWQQAHLEAIDWLLDKDLKWSSAKQHKAAEKEQTKRVFENGMWNYKSKEHQVGALLSEEVLTTISNDKSKLEKLLNGV